MSLSLIGTETELKGKFFALKTPQDIANLLEVEYRDLNYYLFRKPVAERYKIFEIRKKSGGIRIISTPATSLKIIQRKLNQVLQCVYEVKTAAHGFAKDKNIVTNAQKHIRQKYVFNVDLKDFFPSINFGRVRGMFMAKPYELDSDVATVLAQICCHDNQLPQGAPTSPIVSNMICSKLDSHILQLAKKHRCTYTRYADDITFSTSMPVFPSSVGIIDNSGQIRVGHALAEIIKNNGFEINTDKIRLLTENQRQEVTGLTINKFPNVKRKYVRQIRAMLYAWKKFGLEGAEQEFWEKYDKKNRSKWNEEPSFKKVVKGKIEFLGMVKGKQDPIYLRFLSQLRELAPELVRNIKTSTDSSKNSLMPIVMTEGITDIKHLKVALAELHKKGEYLGLNPDFRIDDRYTGSPELLKFCNQAHKVPHPQPIICIFDRDEPDILRQVTGQTGDHKNWGHNIFSFALPIPEHRKDTSDICIELYYKDDEIKRSEQSGRRLFLSHEFDPRSGKHKETRTINLSIR